MKYLPICLLAFSTALTADDWSLDGHLKYNFANINYERDNINTVNGSQSLRDNAFHFRLKAEKRWSVWDAKIHYEVLALYGDTQKKVQAGTLSKDEHRLFKLTKKLGNSDKLDAVQRLDRFYLGYNGEQLVIRFGRQTVSWGNGLIFHPLDIFTPFSPVDINKNYKTGDDMLYGQWLFENDDDLQMILLPRRNLKNNQIENEQSSLAFKYHGRYQKEWDFDFALARHFDESVLGFGLSKDVSEAIWRFDVTATHLKEGNTVVSLITNMDYSWVWFEHNFYGYIEYFHNGVGETQVDRYSELALQTRLERGEVYTRGKDYLGTGIQIELTPLFNFYTSSMINLYDQSGIFQIRGIYDLAQDLQLIAWLDIPYGDKGSEFGGIPIDDKYIAPGQRASIRLTYYF
jgi:hypothetical protein